MLPLKFLRKSRNKTFRRGEDVEINKWPTHGLEDHTDFRFTVSGPLKRDESHEENHRHNRFLELFRNQVSPGTDTTPTQNETTMNATSREQRSNLKRRISVATRNMSAGVHLLSQAQKKVSKTPLLPAEPLSIIDNKSGEDDNDDDTFVSIPWDQTKDSIVMEIYDEDLSFEEGFDFELIGSVEIPIRDLIQNFSRLDASQDEVFKWFPIQLGDDVVHKNTSWFAPRLLVRAQIMLRESVNDEGFDSENQEKKSMLHLFSRIKTFMRNFNDKVDGVVSLVEKIANVFNWTRTSSHTLSLSLSTPIHAHPQTDPGKSQAMFLILIFTGVLMLLIPLKFYLLFAIIFPFTKIFRTFSVSVFLTYIF